jgi:hypothetical protein
MKRVALVLVLSLPSIVFTQTSAKMTHVPRCLTTDIALNPTPAIKILLSGFELIRFQGCNRPVEIGIPKEIGKHNLGVYIVRLERNRDPEITYSYWGPLKDALWLGVYRPKYPGIHRFGAENFEPTKADRQDFGWGVDLEGKEYHNAALQWDEHRLMPFVYITNGLFYSETVTDPSKISITKLDPGGKREPNYRMVATRIGANIDFDPDLSSNRITGFATLRFGQETQPLAKMDWDPSGSTRYEIHIENVPLDPTHVMASDFHDYYLALKSATAAKRFDFEFPGKATDQLPCMPGILGGP